MKITQLILGFAICAVLILGIAATRVQTYSETAPATLIETGRGVTAVDGTCTNSFTTAFGSVPKVIPVQFGTVTTTSNLVVSISISNFVYRAGANTVTNDYVAVGAL